MSLFQMIATSRFGFTILNLLIVAVLYSQIGEPLPFFLCGTGFVLTGYFIKRLIRRMVHG